MFEFISNLYEELRANSWGLNDIRKTKSFVTCLKSKKWRVGDDERYYMTNDSRNYSINILFQCFPHDVKLLFISIDFLGRN